MAPKRQARGKSPRAADLRPAAWNLPVVSYATPERFESLRAAAEALGFSYVFAGPFVRSSYRAEEALAESARRRA